MNTLINGVASSQHAVTVVDSVQLDGTINSSTEQEPNAEWRLESCPNGSTYTQYLFPGFLLSLLGNPSITIFPDVIGLYKVKLHGMPFDSNEAVVHACANIYAVDPAP